MAKFKVGDKVCRVAGSATTAPIGSVTVVTGYDPAFSGFFGDGVTRSPISPSDPYPMFEGNYVLEESAESLARSNDPATSKGKRKANKYEEAVLTALAGANLNGKEIAHVTEHPLNCITPRFAPLVRKDKIKDSGVRRDRQIVWCLA